MARLTSWAAGRYASTRHARYLARAPSKPRAVPGWVQRPSPRHGSCEKLVDYAGQGRPNPCKPRRCRVPAVLYQTRVKPMRLLIVEDDAEIRQSLALLLGESGYVVETEADPTRALARATAEEFELVLCDVKHPAMDGVSFLRRLRAEGGNSLIIMMSPPGSEEAALAALREGAYDYVQQPFKNDEVIMAVRKAEERERLRREVESLRSNLGIGAVKELVVSQSRAMRDVLELASRVARHNTPVLITGESGTGKEVVARAIHRMS